MPPDRLMKQAGDRGETEAFRMRPSFLKNEVARYRVEEFHKRSKTGKEDKERRFGRVRLKTSKWRYRPGNCVENSSFQRAQG